jgi:nucleotide-binding universal stress UspA family protein
MSWFSKKKIVVPVDLSQHSLNALDQALLMADSASQIHIVQVLYDTAATATEIPLSPFEMEAQLSETKKILIERFKGEKYRGLSVHVSYGDPGTEIAKHAEDIKADLIVISSHGRRGWKRILIGSVAERVVRLAHCPVFVLKSCQRDAQSAGTASGASRMKAAAKI